MSLAVSVPLNPSGGNGEDAPVHTYHEDGLHHHPEDHVSQRAPWLRAAVLGASDGLVTGAEIRCRHMSLTCLNLIGFLQVHKRT